MDRGWFKAERSFGSGRWSSAWSGLRQAGRASKSGFRYSRKAVAAGSGMVGLAVLGIYVLLAVLNPSPENVSAAAEEAAMHEVPDPGSLVGEFLLAGVLFVGGFFVWKEAKKKRRR